MTAAELRREMPETELTEWAMYVARREFPNRRIVAQLALIAMLVDRGLCGAKDTTLSDYFIFDEVEVAGQSAPETAAVAFQFNPTITRK